MARRRRSGFQRRPQEAFRRDQPSGAHVDRPGEVDRRQRLRPRRYPSQAAHARRRLHRADRQEPAGIVMRAYLALIRIDIRLAARDRSVIFFNYLFPLIFFFVFSEMMGASRSGGITNVVTMVLTIGILGNGLWGAGMRAAQEREMNILRRFKVTPISPAPILLASLVTGWILYLPAVLLVCTLAHFIYGMPVPERWPSLFALVSLGVVAFRSIGLILASIVNSTQESNISIQLLYMPMLFLSGATFPTTMLPAWAQTVGQFLPATYLVTGFQSVFMRKETLAQNLPAVAALLVTMALATFISI